MITKFKLGMYYEAMPKASCDPATGPGPKFAPHVNVRPSSNLFHTRFSSGERLAIE
jgi:hypothetical protein